MLLPGRDVVDAAGPARPVRLGRASNRCGCCPTSAAAGKEALACYGLLRADTGAMLLRFVEGRPVSQVTEDFLAWLCERFAAEGKKVFVLVWDNASWHVSQRVRRWIGAHNRRVKREGGLRIRVCYLPVKAPWLNPIEPKWLHGKRAIVEPDAEVDRRRRSSNGSMNTTTVNRKSRLHRMPLDTSNVANRGGVGAR